MNVDIKEMLELRSALQVALKHNPTPREKDLIESHIVLIDLLVERFQSKPEVVIPTRKQALTECHRAYHDAKDDAAKVKWFHTYGHGLVLDALMGENNDPPADIESMLRVFFN